MPPPQQLLAAVPPTISTASFVPVPVSPSATVPMGMTFLSQGCIPQPASFMSCGKIQPNIGSYPQPSVSGGTSYNGYGGIYPQATPFHQVALALKNSASPMTSKVSPVAAVASPTSFSSKDHSSEKERRQKRKFQELPANSMGPAKPHQVFCFQLVSISRRHKFVGIAISMLQETERMTCCKKSLSNITF